MKSQNTRNPYRQSKLALKGSNEEQGIEINADKKYT